jgi:hypothetical protein
MPPFQAAVMVPGPAESVWPLEQYTRATAKEYPLLFMQLKSLEEVDWDTSTPW